MASPASGHIERLPSGSYRAHVYAGKDPLTGRELRHRQTAKTMEQAQIAATATRATQDGDRRDTLRAVRIFAGA